MSVELHICWDGELASLRNHRLSQGLFAEALRLLLVALRREASAIATKEVGETDAPTTGRLKRAAEGIDLELAAIRGGCTDLQFFATQTIQPGRSADLFAEDLLAKAAANFLADVEEEGHGRPVSGWTRKYLRALPVGVTSQRYQLLRDGIVQRETSLGKMELVEESKTIPGFRRVEGKVAGVDFPPATPQVRIELDDGTPQQCQATAEQVEKALQLRGTRVAALIQGGPKKRLLWLRPADAEPVLGSPEKRSTFIHATWGETLRRLSK